MIKFLKVFLILILVSAAHFQMQAQTDSLTNNETAGIDSLRKNRVLIYPGFGISLVRNEFTPVFYINLGFNHKNRYEANVNTSSYFFFERDDDKNYNLYRNTFLNAEFLLNFSMLSRYEKNMNGLGVGYLIESKGQYFKETTVVFYYKRKFSSFSVMPGIVFADNFRDVFPVIGIRL